MVQDFSHQQYGSIYFPTPFYPPQAEISALKALRMRQKYTPRHGTRDGPRCVYCSVWKRGKLRVSMGSFFSYWLGVNSCSNRDSVRFWEWFHETLNTKYYAFLRWLDIPIIYIYIYTYKLSQDAIVAKNDITFLKLGGLGSPTKPSFATVTHQKFPSVLK